MDFTNLTWQQFALVAVVVAGTDFVVSVLAAIVPPNYFSFASVAKVLETHVLKRVIPIAALAALALSFPSTSAEHTGLWASACAALALYVAETVKSLMSSVQVAQAVAAETPPPDGLTADAVPDDLSGVPS
jgi:hypothetical protein